jgi:hypothetical protein
MTNMRANESRARHYPLGRLHADNPSRDSDKRTLSVVFAGLVIAVGIFVTGSALAR